eukprot:1988196-Pleurochrysis_carterae.AAC.2
MSIGSSIDRARKVQLFHVLRDALARGVRDVGSDGRILLLDGHVPADVGGRPFMPIRLIVRLRWYMKSCTPKYAQNSHGSVLRFMRCISV